MVYKVLGTTSAILLFLQISLFVMRRAYKYLPKKPNWFPPILKFLKSAHIYTGIALLIIGFNPWLLCFGNDKITHGSYSLDGYTFCIFRFLVQKQVW
nr:hypothetical protein [Fervidobacterium pennivorans]